MLNKSHNPNILNDVMKVLRGETKEKKNLPQSLKDAAVSAAKDIRVLMEGVASAEYKRDTIRVHLHEGLKGCGCQPSVELINDFQDEVEQNLRKPVAVEAADPKPLETPASVAKKTKSPVGSGTKMPVNTGLRGTKSNPKEHWRRSRRKFERLCFCSYRRRNRLFENHHRRTEDGKEAT